MRPQYNLFNRGSVADHHKHVAKYQIIYNFFPMKIIEHHLFEQIRRYDIWQINKFVFPDKSPHQKKRDWQSKFVSLCPLLDKMNLFVVTIVQMWNQNYIYTHPHSKSSSCKMLFVKEIYLNFVYFGLLLLIYKAQPFNNFRISRK